MISQLWKKQIAALEEAEQVHASDYQKLMELGAQKEEINAQLLELYDKWEELSDE